MYNLEVLAGIVCPKCGHITIRYATTIKWVFYLCKDCKQKYGITSNRHNRYKLYNCIDCGCLFINLGSNHHSCGSCSATRDIRKADANEQRHRNIYG